MSIGLVAKAALVTVMVITGLWGDTIISPEEGGDSGPCSDPSSSACCYHQCIHDASSGCNGSGRCCTNLCA